ncbi:MAG TPA: YggS family pyridoxal phosphate-dependent enzyme [Saprospiraceae bacterium]|nr:YggS family pyridoxal phosphate-dependent enzyme [Saprospiraceae bacterium]HNT21510.1 YggS family pyridoxal phosphate-dependent enzyme [Saprospiraceae bacterium]
MYKAIKQYCDLRNVELLVVSKMRSDEEIMQVYREGQRLFGENRVQDLLLKKDRLPADIQWHLIGTLQRNKVKYIAPFISMIQSVDDLPLWQEIHRQAVKTNRVIPCLLQVKIAREESKEGFDPHELHRYLADGLWRQWNGVSVRGLMGMASLTPDQEQWKREFRTLRAEFESIRDNYFQGPEFNILSMGMSADYKIAIEEGANLVRVGSAVFAS